MMEDGTISLPAGVQLVQALRGRKFTPGQMKILVLVMTFLCYASYHASRKPPSIVKSVLHVDPPTTIGESIQAEDLGDGWAPFDSENGKALLGNVDFAFLIAYAFGMFFAGHLGDRVDLRLFLTAGMLGSGVFVSMFGMGYFWDIHDFNFYVLVSIAAGLMQSTGWPSVVSVMANWYGKGKRGLVMGVWNAHTSVGNIAGTVLAARFLQYGWGWSYIIPGALVAFCGVLMFTFLVVQPSDMGVKTYKPIGKDASEDKGATVDGKGDSAHGISFWQAWLIPGVTPFALCLFFAKLVAYTFLYWLPFYIRTTPIDGEYLSAKQSGDLSILFDVGGVAGGVVAGFLSDYLGASGLTAGGFLACSIPVLYAYRTYGDYSMAINVSLMMLSGFFVNGPYALITTAVSADLGSSDSLSGNQKALATVTAIIDGMGSIGAAIGPSLVGYISQSDGGFDSVFQMLYLSAMFAGLLLVRVMSKEWSALRKSMISS